MNDAIMINQILDVLSSSDKVLTTSELSAITDIHPRALQRLAKSEALRLNVFKVNNTLHWSNYMQTGVEVPENGTITVDLTEEQDDKVLCLQAALKRMESDNKKLRLLLATRREEARIVAGSIPKITPPSITLSRKSGIDNSSHTLLLALSDWHIGEVVSKDETGGVNEYNYGIAKAGIESIISNILRWVENQRLGYTIDNVQILGMGDWISGDIHEELTATNEFTAPVSAAKAGALLANAIATLAPHFKSVKVDLIGGNHDRLSKHTPNKHTTASGLGYMVGEIAKESLKSFANVQFTTHESPMPVIDVNGKRIIFAHGHQIKSTGNSPYYGFARRAAALRTQYGDYDHLFIGHFHSFSMLNESQVVVVPSLIGPNEFSLQLGLTGKPGQFACLVGKYGIHGVTIFGRF